MSRNVEVLHRGPAQNHFVRESRVRKPSEEPKPSLPQRSVAEDELLKLIERVFICPLADKPPGVVCFCGVDFGAGCSWVCAHAGELLAETTTGRICLLDANIHSPSLHEYFGAPLEPGLAEAVNDSGKPIRNFVRATWSTRLWLMTSGVAKKKPEGSLNPQRIQARVSELRREFDFMLVDAPPINACSDAIVFGRVSDGAILVLNSNATRREAAQAAKENLQASRVPVLGAVLNRRTFPIPEALYRRL